MAGDKKVQIDYNVKEIIDNLNKAVKFTKEDKKRIEDSLNFDVVIENIDISDNSNRVIFTDGNEQLVYENGEFFLVSSTDSTSTKKKKKRNEARNMYIEYFIKYQLNPIIKQRKLNEITKTISATEIPNKKQKVGEELKNEVIDQNKDVDKKAKQTPKIVVTKEKEPKIR